MSRKPRARPRAPRGAKADEDALSALEERYAREGTAPAGTSVGVSTSRRLDGQSPASEEVASSSPVRAQVKRPPKPTGPGIVWREGRLLADGSRRGAGWLRRMTVYLPPELARRLEVETLETGEDKSAVISTALADWLDARGR